MKPIGIFGLFIGLALFLQPLDVLARGGRADTTTCNAPEGKVVDYSASYGEINVYPNKNAAKEKKPSNTYKINLTDYYETPHLAYYALDLAKAQSGVLPFVMITWDDKGAFMVQSKTKARWDLTDCKSDSEKTDD